MSLFSAADLRENEQHIVESFNLRTESWRDWRERVERFDRFQRGEWTYESGDGRKRTVSPKIENRARTGIEDIGKLAAEVLPTMRVESPSEAGEERAKAREQLIHFYHQLSGTAALYPHLYMDMGATGLACISVWPDFRRSPEERFPLFRRLDPRGALLPPNWNVGQPLEDFMYVRHMKLRTLKSLYPDAMLTFHGDGLRDDTEAKIVEFYSRDRIQCIAQVGNGRSGESVTLYAAPNRIGRIPIVPVPRPTVDGRLAGVMDDVLVLLAAQNRVVTMGIDYVDQAVYAPIQKKGMQGQNIDFGPGAIIDVPPDGEVGRVSPAPIQPGVLQIINDLERDSRAAGRTPISRTGESPSSVVSAPVVEALMGGMSTEVKALQTQMAHALVQANEIAQLVDVAYCDARKSIIGFAEGGQFRMTYTPSKAIKPGDVSNRVFYGAAAGVGEFNRELVVLRRRGVVSDRWIRENLAGVENPLREENRMLDEAALNALLQGVLAAASQGDLAPLAAFQEARARGENPLLVVPMIVASQGGAASSLGAPATPAQPLALPGEATPGQQIAAQAQSLPPLAQLTG